VSSGGHFSRALAARMIAINDGIVAIVAGCRWQGQEQVECSLIARSFAVRTAGIRQRHYHCFVEAADGPTIPRQHSTGGNAP
jgi:hypothetical protein